jgi:hypothetical protein
MPDMSGRLLHDLQPQKALSQQIVKDIYKQTVQAGCDRPESVEIVST